MTPTQPVVLPRPPDVRDEGTAPAEPASLDDGPGARHRSITRWFQPQLAFPFLGLGSWAYGLDQVRTSGIGSYGLLASANVWFVLGLSLLVAGLVLELRRSSAPRGWLLGLLLVGLIVAIHSTVPILFGAPEYAWVYKHIGVISAFERYGHITDPSNIYQQWPALFSAVAAISSLAHIGPLSFAAWAPLAFELADALLLLAIFRQLTDNRRIVWLAVVLYEGLVSWVGQDYLSPQAFGYLLWLGVVLIILRWLRAAAPASGPRGRLGRLRASLLAGLPPAPATTKATRAVAIVLVSAIYFAIVAAHQLTPYMALAGIGALAALGLVRARWLLVLLAAIAGGYLAPHYDLIAHQFGGLFSGASPLQNAVGKTTPNPSPGARLSGDLVDGLVGAMWLMTLVVIALRRRRAGRVAIATALAFSPFAILVAQSYGGEAIYRVYLFSAPWCALLIAGALCELRLPLRWLLVAAACFGTLFAGVQGLYGPVLTNAFTPAELNASVWLYSHAPRGSLIVLPVLPFPTLESADYNHYEVQAMPADPQLGESWMNEGNLPQVENWIAGLGHRSAYVVVSRSMRDWANYYGAPKGYAELVGELPSVWNGSVVYHNDDTTIYRLNVPGGS
jgi:hypothetical protein